MTSVSSSANWSLSFCILRNSSSWLTSLIIRSTLLLIVLTGCFISPGISPTAAIRSMAPRMIVRGVRNSCEILVKKRSLNSVSCVSTLMRFFKSFVRLKYRQTNHPSAARSIIYIRYAHHVLHKGGLITIGSVVVTLFHSPLASSERTSMVYFPGGKFL